MVALQQRLLCLRKKVAEVVAEAEAVLEGHFLLLAAPAPAAAAAEGEAAEAFRISKIDIENLPRSRLAFARLIPRLLAPVRSVATRMSR